MNDLAHDPLLVDAEWSHRVPAIFTLGGPGEGQKTEVYMCSICHVFYEEDEGNVCAARLARKLSS